MFEAIYEDGVGVGGVDEVVADDLVGGAETFGFEVAEDLREGVAGPFFIADFAGGLDDEGGVSCWADEEAGIFRFADAMVDAVTVVSVEGVHALFPFYKEGVDGHGFEAKLVGGVENLGRGWWIKGFDEVRKRDCGEEL